MITQFKEDFLQLAASAKSAIDKAISLNQAGLLGDKIYFNLTAEDAFYAPRDNTVHLKLNSKDQSLNNRIFYHESTHAILEQFYKCGSNPFYCDSNLSLRSKFYSSALDSALSLASYLGKNELSFDGANYHDILLQLKAQPDSVAFWMLHVESTLHQNLDDFWGGTSEEEVPFDLNEALKKLSRTPQECFNIDQYIFRSPSYALFELSKHYSENLQQKNGYSQIEVEFLKQMSTLLYYDISEYDFEIIARMVEFEHHFAESSIIRNITRPLLDFFNTHFIPEVNRMYDDFSSDQEPVSIISIHGNDKLEF